MFNPISTGSKNVILGLVGLSVQETRRKISNMNHNECNENKAMIGTATDLLQGLHVGLSSIHATRTATVAKQTVSMDAITSSW